MMQSLRQILQHLWKHHKKYHVQMQAHTHISVSAESLFPTQAPATAQPDAACKNYFALELTYNALHTMA